MEKFKRIAALLAVVVLIVCALLTLIFAFMGNEAAWKASAYCMVIIPIMIYIMMWLAKVYDNRGQEFSKEQSFRTLTITTFLEHLHISKILSDFRAISAFTFDFHYSS